MTSIVRAARDLIALLRSRPAHSPRLAHNWYVAWLSGWRLLAPLAKYVVPLPTLVRLTCGSVGPRANVRAVVDAREALLARLYAEHSPLLPSNCLERALVLHGTLAPAWPDTQLIVGFRHGEGGVHGHTWVTRDGVLQLEPMADVLGFVPAFRFDASGTRVPAATTPPAA